jgi:hypothetical protein
MKHHVLLGAALMGAAGTLLAQDACPNRGELDFA